MKGKTKGYSMSALPQNTGGRSPQSRNYAPHTRHAHCAWETPTRHTEGSEPRRSVLIAQDIMAMSHMSIHMPVDGQGVRTRSEGSGKEADSPCSKAAKTLSFSILQILETQCVLGKSPHPRSGKSWSSSWLRGWGRDSTFQRGLCAESSMPPFAFWPLCLPRQPLSRRHALVFVFFNFHVSSQADPMVLRVLGCQGTRVSLWSEYTMMPSQKNPTLSPKQFSSHDLPPWRPPHPLWLLMKTSGLHVTQLSPTHSQLLEEQTPQQTLKWLCHLRYLHQWKFFFPKSTHQ